MAVDLVAAENVDAPIVAALRVAGHNVVYVRVLAPGIDVARVLEIANSHDALVLTSDKDFGELVFRQGLIRAGVLLYSLAGIAARSMAPCREARFRRASRTSWDVRGRGSGGTGALEVRR